MESLNQIINKSQMKSTYKHLKIFRKMMTDWFHKINQIQEGIQDPVRL